MKKNKKIHKIILIRTGTFGAHQILKEQLKNNLVSNLLNINKDTRAQQKIHLHICL